MERICPPNTESKNLIAYLAFHGITQVCVGPLEGHQKVLECASPTLSCCPYEPRPLQVCEEKQPLGDSVQELTQSVFTETHQLHLPFLAFCLLQAHLAAMGIDAGFDMVPRLSKGAVDSQNWKSFIKTIKEHYQNDDLVEVKSNYIEFKACEHPLLPFEGHKFLRFSSKISDSHAEGVEEYIDTVTRVAKVCFGSRARYWNEAFDEWEFYNWSEVHDSIETYEKVCCDVLNESLGFASVRRVSVIDAKHRLDICTGWQTSMGICLHWN